MFMERHQKTELNPSSRKTDWEISGKIVLFAKEWLGNIRNKEIDFRLLLKDCIGRSYSLEKIEKIINQIPILEFLVRKKGIKIINIPKIPSREEFQRRNNQRFYESHGYFPSIERSERNKQLRKHLKGYKDAKTKAEKETKTKN